jgi:hypothetical protein
MPQANSTNAERQYGLGAAAATGGHTESKSPSKAAPAKSKPTKREWIPKFWDGMSLGGWMRLLARNRFDLDWQYWHFLPLVTGLSTLNSLVRGWTEIVAGRHVTATKIKEPPIFILGHWRSGTTLLHELLILDERHTCPTTFSCFAANHFVLTEEWLPHLLGFMAPERRFMDNMKAGWSRPQEDEFALCNLGLPSPYLTIAFPNHGPQFNEYLTLEDVPAADREHWKRELYRFLQKITLIDPRRIVLKSPPHTCRIPPLLEMFPEARFVHIIRDPYVIFPSTVHLWKQLYRRQGLQKPTFAGLEDHVFRTFQTMYRAFESQRKLIDPRHFCEVRYEDLVRDPLGQIERVYRELELGGFEAARPKVEQYFSEHQDYRTNEYELPPALRDRITREWGDVIDRWGYARSKAAASPR